MPRIQRQRTKRPSKPRYTPRRKVCAFCVDKTAKIDYKDVSRLIRYITDRGKIMSRRRSGTCARHQRLLAVAIKRSRHIALLPYTPLHIQKTAGIGLQG